MKHMKSMISMLLAAVLLLSGGAQALAAGTVTPTQASGAIFGVKFEGDQVEGTGEVVDGVYRIAAAKTDGEAWHVKLECNYPTVAGHEYRVTYRFTSDVAGKVKFGDFQEFKIEKGENELTGLVIAKDSTTYLDLQLGMLPSFTMDFTQVEVRESQDETEYEDALPQPIRFDAEDAFYERHDQGYSPDFTATADSVTVNYYSSGWDAGVWKARLYVNTGMVPQPGNKYRISADVRCEKDMDFEVLLNKEEQEKGYGALYGRHLTAGETSTVEHILTIPSSGFADGELVLQFSLGNAPEETDITISNVHVDKVIDHYTDLLPTLFALDQEVFNGKSRTVATPTDNKDVPLTNFSYSGTDTVYKTNDDDYTVTLTEAADSATLSITQAPEDRGVWKVRLFAETGVVLEAGATYRIKYDLASTGNQAVYEVVFNGDTEGAYGFDKNRSLTAGGTDHMETLVTPDASHGPLTLLFQLGKTDTTAGNTVTLSGLSVEKVSAEYAPAETVDLSTGTEGSVWEEHDPGFEQTVTVSGTTVTMDVTAGPDSADEWNSKLNIDTGLVLEAGAKYRVSAKLEAAAALNNYHIRWNNEGAADPYVGEWNLPDGGARSYIFTAPASADDCHKLILTYEIGKMTAPNTITVSEISVQKLDTAGAETAILPESFGYPTVSEGSTAPNAFTLTTPDGTAATLTGNGSSATATINTPGEGIVLKAATGATLEAGKSYRIEASVEGTGGYGVCFAREGGGNWDFDGGAIEWGNPIVNAVTPAQSGDLNILLTFDGMAADSTVTIKNIAVYEVTDAELDSYSIGTWQDGENGSRGTNVDTSLIAGGATGTVTASDGTDWHCKFTVKPDIELASGSKYRVEASVEGAGGCSVHFKDGSGKADPAWDETAYGAANFLSGDEKQTVSSNTFDGLDGYVEIVLLVGTRAAEDVVTLSDLKVIKVGGGLTPVEMTGFAYPETIPTSVDPKSFTLTKPDENDSSLSGNGTSATVTVNTAADGIVLKAATGATLEAQKSYRIEASVEGTGGYGICFAREGGGNWDFDGGNIVWGDPIVNAVTPAQGGDLNILLTFDGMAAGSSVTIKSIAVYEITDDTYGENLMTDPLVVGDSGNVNMGDNAAGYAAAVSAEDGAAKVTFTAVPGEGREDWKVKLYAHTGVALTAGKTYRVSADVASTAAMEYAIAYNGTGEGDLGNRSGLTADTAAKTVSYEIAAGSDANLDLQFNLGLAPTPCTVTVSNVKVEEMTSSTAENLIPSFAYNSIGSFRYAADDGYVVSLAKAESSATFTIHRAPAAREPYYVKLNVNTGLTPEKDQAYLVSFDLDAAKAQPGFQVFFDGDKEEAYGQQFGPQLKAGKNTVTQIIYPGESKGELVLQLRFGNTKGTDGNSCTVSNVKIQKVKLVYTTVVEKEETNLWAHDTYSARLSRTDKQASVRITKTPKTGAEPWKTKLFVPTGVKLQAGQKYRVRLEAFSNGYTPYEICFNKESEEKGFSALYGLTATPEPEAVEYIFYADKDGYLTLQFSLGAATAPCTFTISNVKVEKAGKVSDVSDTIYTF